MIKFVLVFNSLGQVERDSHIAACLSAAEEDVMW